MFGKGTKTRKPKGVLRGWNIHLAGGVLLLTWGRYLCVLAHTLCKGEQEKVKVNDRFSHFGLAIDIIDISDLCIQWDL